MKYNRVEFYKQKVCQDCGNQMFRGRTAKRCLDCDGIVAYKYKMISINRMLAKKAQEAHA